MFAPTEDPPPGWIEGEHHYWDAAFGRQFFVEPKHKLAAAWFDQKWNKIFFYNKGYLFQNPFNKQEYELLNVPDPDPHPFPDPVDLVPTTSNALKYAERYDAREFEKYASACVRAIIESGNITPEAWPNYEFNKTEFLGWYLVSCL